VDGIGGESLGEGRREKGEKEKGEKEKGEEVRGVRGGVWGCFDFRLHNIIFLFFYF